jgi:hypothetical protein
MKVVESVPVTEDAIKKHKEHGVRTVKDIIESAELGPLPESLLYEMEDYLYDKVAYLKFQKDFYSKYSLTLEQKYFLTTYYIYIDSVSDIDPKDKEDIRQSLKKFVDRLVMKVKKYKILILENVFIISLISQES